jgi:WD40 repeat protein
VLFHPYWRLTGFFVGLAPMRRLLQATFVAHSLNQQQRYVACGSEDHHVYFWDLQTKQVRWLVQWGQDVWWRVWCASDTWCVISACALAVCCPQIAGILRGRPSPDAAGDGHCNTVLTVDAAMAAGRELIASGGHMGDGTIKIWASSQQPVPMEP